MLTEHPCTRDAYSPPPPLPDVLAVPAEARPRTPATARAPHTEAASATMLLMSTPVATWQSNS